MLENGIFRIGIATAFALSAGCSADNRDDADVVADRSVTRLSQVSEGSGDAGVASATFPCAVQTILQANCLVCHGEPPLAAPFSLATPASFQGPSYGDPERSMVSVVKERISAELPALLMPPPAFSTLTESELATLNGWLDDGAIAGVACADAGQDAPADSAKMTPRDDQVSGVETN